MCIQFMKVKIYFERKKKPIFKRKEPSNFFHDSTIEERGNGKKLSSLKEGKMCRFLLF